MSALLFNTYEIINEYIRVNFSQKNVDEKTILLPHFIFSFSIFFFL